MDIGEQSPARQIAIDASGAAMAALLQSLGSVFGIQKANDALDSIKTTEFAANEIAKHGINLIMELERKIFAATHDQNARDLIIKTVEAFCDGAILIVGRLLARVVSSNSAKTEDATLQLLESARLRVMAAMASASKAYTHATVAPATAKPRATKRPPASPTGRQPAAFWDDMWAATTAAMYDGTLNPKTQADIERFMSEWIEGAGLTAAPSNVRARARRLWAKVKPDAI